MISIITSLYKSESHLKNFLGYLEKFSQELTRLSIVHEFIILPNDPSLEENTLLSSCKNSNIKIIPRARESLYASWNFGVSEASYKFITFWNVDDIRFSEAVEKAIRVSNPDHAEITYFPFIYKRYIRIWKFDILAKRVIVQPAEFDHKRFLKEMHIGPFFIATKKAFEVNGLFDDTFRIAGDYDWAVRAVKRNVNFQKINTVAGVFKNNGLTLSGSKDALQQGENKRIQQL